MDRWASLHLSQITGKTTQAKRFKTFFFRVTLHKYESKIDILGDFILRPETFFFFFVRSIVENLFRYLIIKETCLKILITSNPPFRRAPP